MMLRSIRSLAAVLASVLVLLLPVSARADKPQWGYLALPFAQMLNMEAVYEVTHSAPHRLVETIQRWGVDIQLVRSEAPSRPLNPLLAGLPPAAPELLRQVDFLDTYEGLVVHANGQPGAPSRTTILIRDTALSYTLIHEFVQSLLQPAQAVASDHALKTRFGAAFRRLMIYQRSLADDPFKLLNPLWRRDILAAQTDVAQDLFARIRMGQSQEAIVERVLSVYIDERNPFFDAVRREQGLAYGAVMISNAFEVFNALNDSIAFVRDTVRQLGQSLRDGNIRAGQDIALSDEDETSFFRSASDIESRLALVRAELQVLKQFYSH